MTTHTTERVLPYSRECVFDLVADVESYPDFLPFWRQAKINARHGNVYYTDQEIWMGVVRERFRTKTILNRPTTIDVLSYGGIFEGLSIHWDFATTPEGGCQIEFTQSLRLRSFFKQQVLGFLLAENSHAVINAFEKRAHELYRTYGIQDGHYPVVHH
uniref:Coenzyme Q-binding protein COQ10 n=1 Tax=Candidatus Kentrum eta TaxID=2126337 RepID=A0A450VAM6_9GAMM|nr:MAG: coenzyme Q-binding protein COQ10 [Candidatus Kentron sp. H]VFJ94952.1 MAG: coenzyme Q-binding protein COQ10 [Candidatus Kentron sp. H]VFK01828.1 MAG: coenzyme Q-binding protein COQ10 [Candidatus Kentron sp. H]